jgi:hypothetical protein
MPKQVTAHAYLSTSCLHAADEDRTGEERAALHARCSSAEGVSDSGERWAKAPACCKHCGAPCRCLCHGGPATDVPDRSRPLGKLVRDVWVRWAKEQPDAKPSWLVPWNDLPAGDPQREAARLIEHAVSVHAAYTERERCARLITGAAEKRALALGPDNSHADAVRQDAAMLVALIWEMTMTDVPEAILMRGAVAIHDADCGDQTCSGSALGHCYKLAAAALTAVVPLIRAETREQSAQGLRDAIARVERLAEAAQGLAVRLAAKRERERLVTTEMRNRFCEAFSQILDPEDGADCTLRAVEIIRGRNDTTPGPSQAYSQGVKAERSRIRQLAEEHRATYEGSQLEGCDCGQPDCPVRYRPHLPFAALIGDSDD